MYMGFKLKCNLNVQIQIPCVILRQHAYEFHQQFHSIFQEEL